MGKETKDDVYSLVMEVGYDKAPRALLKAKLVDSKAEALRIVKHIKISRGDKAVKEFKNGS